MAQVSECVGRAPGSAVPGWGVAAHQGTVQGKVLTPMSHVLSSSGRSASRAMSVSTVEGAPRRSVRFPAKATPEGL